MSFENTKFLKTELSGLSFHGSNISGAEFDSYTPEQNPEADKPDSFAMIYWRGYGRPEKSLRDIDEATFAEELVESEDSEKIRARYPAEGFKMAWAWRDRPPKGIPKNIDGPILCDEALRIDKVEKTFDVDGIPDKCKPDYWVEPTDNEMIRVNP